MASKPTCQFCGKPVLVSRHNYRTTSVQKDGAWVTLYRHTACDPYRVRLVVEPKP